MNKLKDLAVGGQAVSTPLDDSDFVKVQSERTKAAIKGLRCQQRVKTRLLQLWETMFEYFSKNGDFPRQSEITQIMDLPRQRVNEDFSRLRTILTEIWDLNPDKS